MKSKHFGKVIILLFIFACLATAIILKQLFHDSSAFKGLATDQMRMEFLAYQALKTPSPQMQVAAFKNTRFFVNLQESWKFEIHDKTLVIYPPPIAPKPEASQKDEIEGQATQTLTQAARIWLEDKYHSQKDLLVEIHFDQK